MPLPAYSGATWGMVDVLFDKNVVSKIPPYAEVSSGKTAESLALATYRAMIGDASPAGRVRDGKYVVNPLRSIPLNSDGVTLIPFFREPKTYPAYSLADVLS